MGYDQREVSVQKLIFFFQNNSYVMSKQNKDHLSPPHRPPVVSIIAKSGTGKTTFLEKLIRALRGHGLRVGVLKHHSHTSSFDVPGKDTHRMAVAGAEVVVGASAVQTAVFIQQSGSDDLDAVIARFLSDMDIVLTEGYKRGDYPKIEVHRAARSSDLLCQPDELLLAVTDEPLDLPTPQFGLNDAAGVAAWLVAWAKER